MNSYAAGARRSLSLILLTLSALVGGCYGDARFLAVLSVSPEDGAIDVPLNAAVTVRFDLPVDPSSVHSESFYLTETGTGARLRGAIAQTAGDTYVLRPSALLPARTLIRAVVTTGVSTRGGESLEQRFEWVFMTGVSEDSGAPTVTSITPSASAPATALDTPVTVEFSEPMNSIHTAAAIRVVNDHDGAQVPGTVTTADGIRFTFRPAGGWDYASRYRVDIAASASDLAGIRLAATYSDTFLSAAPFAQPAGGAIRLLGPADFSGGTASHTVASLGTNENLSVILVHARQSPPASPFGADHVRFTVSASGFAPSASKPTARSLPLEIEDSKRKKLKKLRETHIGRMRDTREKMKKRGKDEESAPGPIARRQLPLTGFGRCPGPYTVGSTECLIDILSADDQFEDVTVRLAHESASARWWVDTGDWHDLSTAELAALGNSFESDAVTTVRSYFGEASDVDGSGKINIVLSSWLVNPDTGVALLGYVAPWDFYPDGTWSELESNEGDFLYLATPGALADVGYTREEYFGGMMPSTMVHELKHLVADGQRYLSGAEFEEIWIEEPSAVAASELAGLGSQIGDTQPYARHALPSPQDFRVVYSGQQQTNDELISVYGFNFLFLWRAAEQAGHSSFWKSWVAGPGIGKANFEAHAGRSFANAMLDWSLTLAFDHTGSLPAYSYESLNLRDGTWAEVGVAELQSSQVLDVRSMAFFKARGNGSDVQLSFQANDSVPFVLIVRTP